MSFPVASRILEFKWQEERFRKHRYQIRNALPTVNVKPPKLYPHILLNVNKIAIEEEKLARYERENQILLQNLRNIVRGHGRLDNWNHAKKKTDLHTGARLKQQREIEWQNQKMLKRIKATKPVIQKKKQDRDYKNHRLHKSILDTPCKSYPLVKRREPMDLVDDDVDLHKPLKSNSKPKHNSHNTTTAKKNTRVRDQSPLSEPIKEIEETRYSTDPKVSSPEPFTELKQKPESSDDEVQKSVSIDKIEDASTSPIDEKPAEYASDYETESEADQKEELVVEEKVTNSERMITKNEIVEDPVSASHSEEADEDDYENRTATVPKLPKI